MIKRISKLYHRLVSVYILLKYNDLEIAKQKSFEYYRKNVLKKN